MSVRTFLFCDFCNPGGLRTVEYQRCGRRPSCAGRRREDGRAWFEGTVEEAVEQHGWHCTEDGYHLCPECKARLTARPGARLGAFHIALAS